MEYLYQWTLPGGLQVIFEHAPHAQVTSFDLLTAAGQYNETQAQRGWTHLIASMYDRGCKGYAELDIQTCMFEHQIDFDGIMGNHFLGLEFQAPSSKWQQALQLCKALFVAPVFDASKLDQEVQVIVQAIETSQNDPTQVLSQHFFAEIFAGHPYADHAWGRRDTLAQATPEKLLQFYQRLLGQQWYLNMVGPQDPAELKAFLQAHFAALPAGCSSLQDERIKPQTGGKVLRIASEFEKLYGARGFATCGVDNSDRFALEWVRQYWVHGLGGRLFERIREELGLVYNIDCSNSFLREGGCMLISYGADLFSEKAIDQVLAEEVDRICQSKVPILHFERMQKYIRGSATIEWDPIVNHVHFYNQAKLYQTTLDYQQELGNLLAVTRQEVQQVAQKYLTSSMTDIKLVPKT